MKIRTLESFIEASHFTSTRFYFEDREVEFAT